MEKLPLAGDCRAPCNVCQSDGMSTHQCAFYQRKVLLFLPFSSSQSITHNKNLLKSAWFKTQIGPVTMGFEEKSRCKWTAVLLINTEPILNSYYGVLQDHGLADQYFTAFICKTVVTPNKTALKFPENEQKRKNCLILTWHALFVLRSIIWSFLIWSNHCSLQNLGW